MRDPRPDHRRGSALALTLLLLLALTLISHGALVLARHQIAVARSGVGRVRARLAAESAVRVVLREWSPAAASGLEPGGAALETTGVVAPGAAWTTRVIRLSSELFLVEAAGTAPPTSGGWRVGRVVWAPSVEARMGEWDHGLRAGGAVTVEAGSGILAGDPLAEPPGWASDSCSDDVDLLASTYPDGVVPPYRSGLAPSDVDTPPWPYPHALGSTDWDGLLARLARVDGTVEPRPAVVFGACDEADPLNWGAPSDPGHPCAAWSVRAGARGPLEVRGGAGQGLLVVRGDLRLSSEHRFVGLVLVGGDLELTGGARIHGLVRAGGDVRLGGSSRIAPYPCAAVRALEAARELLSPVPVPGRSWLSAF